MFAKKSLGQNFLTSPQALSKIIESSVLTNEDIVLEVGPGRGTLTDKILEHSKKVFAIEKDDRLIEFLKNKYSKNIAQGKLTLIHGDILEFNPPNYNLVHQNYKIIANIPYYITGQFLRKFLETESQPSHMTLMVQKEVAERIVARDGKESLLSISVKAFGQPRLIQTVKAGSFSPAPKVDSAIIVIDHISKNFFKEISEESFFKIAKAGFSHKRKMLLGNLKNVAEERNLGEIFDRLGISRKVRAEDINLEIWKKLVACFL